MAVLLQEEYRRLLKKNVSSGSFGSSGSSTATSGHQHTKLGNERKSDMGFTCAPDAAKSISANSVKMTTWSLFLQVSVFAVLMLCVSAFFLSWLVTKFCAALATSAKRIVTG